MRAPERLQARALLIDELYERAIKAEHLAAQEKERADRAEARAKELEPNPPQD